MINKQTEVPNKISHLFLSPCLDHLPWIVLAVPMSETVIALHVPVSVPEVVTATN